MYNGCVIMLQKSVLVLLSVFLLTACQSETPDAVNAEPLVRPARIAVAVSSQGETRRVFPATIAAAQHSALAFRVSGQLQALPVKAGAEVKQGDVLAQLDQTEFKNVLADRQARFELANVQYDQIEALIAKKYTSKTRLDEVRANLRAATAALALAKDNLSYTTLRAPFDGVVAKVDIENYQSVTAQRPVIELQDTREVDVVFNIPEALLTQINPDSDPRSVCGEVRFESRPQNRFNACYKKHDSVPDPATRTYRVVFSMPQEAEFSILPGMAVSIVIDLQKHLLNQQHQDTVRIPVEAVFDVAEQPFVWRLDAQMKARQVAVEPVQIIGDQLQVRGLQAGDQVIAAGVGYVREGQQVRALEKERGL